jgi:hypothetical protein
VSLTLVLFLALLAAEVPLVLGALSTRPRLATPSRVGMFVVPIALAVFARAMLAFSTAHMLEWDETYYVNIAATRARGAGLYPYLFGFNATQSMGCIGYTAYSYALSVKFFGPTVRALRGVALCASVLAIVGMWMAVHARYGSRRGVDRDSDHGVPAAVRDGEHRPHGHLGVHVCDLGRRAFRDGERAARSTLASCRGIRVRAGARVSYPRDRDGLRIPLRVYRSVYHRVAQGETVLAA